MMLFDGDHQIIYSQDFNIYENQLHIKQLAGYDFEFNFKKDAEKKDALIGIHGDDPNKKVTIDLFNFNNSLGTGTTTPVPVLKTTEGKQISFSIHVKSLNESTSFLKVSLTFYLI